MGSRRGKVAIGDVLEVPTPAGFGYVQVTHRHEPYGELVTVPLRLHDERPEDLASHFGGWHNTLRSFITADMLVGAGDLNVVARVPVPEEYAGFPTFRSGLRGEDGRVKWRLWDGERDWSVGELPDGSDLPVLGTLGLEALVDVLENLDGNLYGLRG